jgi:hypothetical protein
VINYENEGNVSFVFVTLCGGSSSNGRRRRRRRRRRIYNAKSEHTGQRKCPELIHSVPSAIPIPRQ